MKLFFGTNGSVNLLLDDWFGFKIPFMEGLNGVIFVDSVHYFPFILFKILGKSTVISILIHFFHL
jgi:iron(III) transport system permease protein